MFMIFLHSTNLCSRIKNEQEDLAINFFNYFFSFSKTSSEIHSFRPKIYQLEDSAWLVSVLNECIGLGARSPVVEILFLDRV